MEVREATIEDVSDLVRLNAEAQSIHVRIAPDVFHDGDEAELLEFFRIAGPYDWSDNDIVTDQRAPGTIVGNWIGNYGSDKPDWLARYASWRRLILGCNSQWWWTMQFAFNGDNTPIRRLAANTEALAEINAGLGKLVVNSRIVREPIVLPHCPPSKTVSRFVKDLTTISSAKGGARSVLSDLCLRHWRIPMKKIVAGELQRAGHKVVLLPFHQAMSERSAQALRRFVEQGGLLIADLRPAVMNEHGRSLKQGFLDATFGITRVQVKGDLALQGKPVIKLKIGPVAALAGFKEEMRVDRSVRARPGAVVGGAVQGVPICIVNRVGKGRAVLLNFALAGYAGWRKEGSAAPARRYISELLAQVGVKPTVRVTTGGQWTDSVHAARWRNGSMRILALDRYPIEPERDAKPLRVKVQWPERGYVYEIRAHRALGPRDALETELAVHVPKLYAWMPYAIGDVTLGAPAGARPGQRVAITVGLGASRAQRAPHVVTLDVYGPDGSWKHYFRQRLRLSGAQARTHITLAHNAPPGDWKLVAGEVISGKTAQRTLRVGE